MVSNGKGDDEETSNPEKRSGLGPISSGGVFIYNLKAGDKVSIETSYFLCDFEVADPKIGRVKVSGRGNTEEALLIIRGSIIQRGVLRPGWIGIGCRLLIGPFTLFETERIIVNGQVIFPESTATVN